MARTTSYPRRRPNKDVEVELIAGNGLSVNNGALVVHAASNGHLTVSTGGVSIDSATITRIATLETEYTALEARVAALEEA